MTPRAEQDILHEIERQQIEQSARVRAIIAEAGNASAVAQYDKDMRDLALGLTGARSVWHSISETQRKVIANMATGRRCLRRSIKPCVYVIDGPASIGHIRLATMRNLSARNLVHVSGTAFDPEAAFVLTEHGRFVVRYGEPRP